MTKWKIGLVVSLVTILIGLTTFGYFLEQALFDAQIAELHLESEAIACALPGLLFCALGLAQATFWHSKITSKD